ncbi:adenylate/guanylate cyclase domain-containing protein [Oleisolibacter albus]|uniref:adenylate/guanylate cyclase domain-containing protein n=1 Tax=Oleisolibacter albus TaxID=2171757 RepID=UPI000DF1D35C|nr:adenylate/guanylate cyclase domain-containing protein [Oleisolibacter albus]
MTTPPFLSDRLLPLADWLFRDGPRDLDLLFAGALERLETAGLPLDRVLLALEFLHPEVSAEGRLWVRGEGLSRRLLERSEERLEDYVNSPMHRVDTTGQAFRVRLDQPLPPMQLLPRLRDEGFTDYAIYPLGFQDSGRSAAISFATRRPGGFCTLDIQDLDRTVSLLSPLLEARVIRTIATDLLTTYLGSGAGRRVYDGQIARGDCESIFAAIWFCDLRHFTGFAQDSLSEAVIQRLNCWFDLAVDAVEAHGGEVLKFMGDGLLAIFPADMLDPRVACGHALAACADLSHAVDAFNRTPPAGQPPIEYGLSLHLGHVAFGNIGGARRLDFTVVGPAVNIASRLLDVAKAQECRVVVSEAFAGCSGRAMQPLGTYPLRGLDQPHAVFTPQG